MRLKGWSAAVCALIVFTVLPGFAEKSFDGNILNGFQYRHLGPFRAGQWVADIAVPEKPEKAHLYTIYIASRNGGIWKSTNNGTTFEPIFDGQDVQSIGCIAIAPSNSDIVWVGSGDASMTRMSYAGDGIYKSTDAGKTWHNMGLLDSQHIARIVIHPRNPDIVYAAAIGHEFSANQERGVFKTTDGGKTWKKVLYINDQTGAVDLVMDRANPNVLYAAMYEKVRLPWKMDFGGGSESGIYKTTDGGKTWHKLAGGLPSGDIGRIGLDLYQKNPKIIYAVVENGNLRPPTEEEIKRAKEHKQEAKPQAFGGEVYRSTDGGKTWTKMNSVNDDVSGKAAYSFNQIRVDQKNSDRIFVTGVSLANSNDGGKTWTGLKWPPNGVFQKAFGDFRTLWIDPENSDRIIAGSDGGAFISYDGGKTCDHFMNIATGGEFYAVTVDMETPYNIYGGLQDHESWRGASESRAEGVEIFDWTPVGTGDGMYNQVDPTDSRWVYNTAEWGQHHRLDQATWNFQQIVPKRRDGQTPLRFNWTPPLLMSPFNSHILYTGAQVLLRSLDRGDHWQEISPDLTCNDPSKISPPGSTIQFCTITTISESSITPGIIWVGSDDGKVQFTRNGGATWTDVTPELAKAGAPEDGWVTRVLASKYAPGTAYVAKSRLRFDDFRPFLFVTTDFGATWKSIAGDLPMKSVNVIVEDPVKSNLLFAGTSSGVYVSDDNGSTWAAFKANMPAVPVHDIVIHPREGDLIAATFGRGLWSVNIEPLREITPDVLKSDFHLFAPELHSRPRGRRLGNGELYGDRFPTTPNEPAVTFAYYLRESLPKQEKVNISIADATGKVVGELKGSAQAGVNVAGWQAIDRRHRAIPPGDYIATFHVGEKQFKQTLRIGTAAARQSLAAND